MANYLTCLNTSLFAASEENLLTTFKTGRRSKLPVPKPDQGDVSLWNLLFRNIGKDLTKISMPVTLNQPLSMLQVNIYFVYRKNSKIWDTSNNCHNCPKNRKVWCNIALMHPIDADGMANSVDPDQTASSEAVWSWSALFAETYLSQYIEFVRYICYFDYWRTPNLL